MSKHTLVPETLFNDWANFSNHFIKKTEEIKKSLGKRSGPNIKWLKEKENDSKLAFPKPDFSTGICTLSRRLTDFESGVGVIAGEPNFGKSTLLVNMALQSLQLNEDLIVVDVSLDDPGKKRYIQYMAAITGMFYQEISTDPALLTANQLVSKEAAHNTIQELYKSGRLWTFESWEDIKLKSGSSRTLQVNEFETLFTLMSHIRKFFPTKKIVFFIDAWNNLDYSSGKGFNDTAQQSYYVDLLKAESSKYEIMSIISAHLRKTNNKKPQLEDIMGPKRLEYANDWTFILRNEWKENWADDPLTYEVGDEMFPMLILEPGKNKVSAWNDPCFYGLLSGSCGIYPLSKQEYISTYAKYIKKRMK